MCQDFVAQDAVYLIYQCFLLVQRLYAQASFIAKQHEIQDIRKSCPDLNEVRWNDHEQWMVEQMLSK